MAEDMLNFIKAMLKAKPAYRNDELGMRNYNRIQTESGYKLSIQCSAHHYCTPRKLSGLNTYDTFELAIFFEDDFVYPGILDEFPRKKELDTCYEGTVFGFVPKDLIEDLYNYLNDIK